MKKKSYSGTCFCIIRIKLNNKREENTIYTWKYQEDEKPTCGYCKVFILVKVCIIFVDKIVDNNDDHIDKNDDTCRKINLISIKEINAISHVIKYKEIKFELFLNIFKNNSTNNNIKKLKDDKRIIYYFVSYSLCFHCKNYDIGDSYKIIK